MILNFRFVGDNRHLHIYDYECLSDKALNMLDSYLIKTNIVRYKDIIVGNSDEIISFLYEFTQRNEVYIE